MKCLNLRLETIFFRNVLCLLDVIWDNWTLFAMYCLKLVFLMEIRIDHGENVMSAETGLRWNDISENFSEKNT